jgi:hypothetical protein
MPRRAVSPTPSENEVDILGSLYTDDFVVGDPRRPGKAPNDSNDFDIGGILDAAEVSQDGDGEDEAFIALKQAAAFRKTSNLRGKSVKKGGGFQAMGRHHVDYFFSITADISPLRSQSASSQGYNQKGFLRPNPHSTQNYSSDPRPEGCCGHGTNRLREDSCVRYPHDRTPQGAQREGGG